VMIGREAITEGAGDDQLLIDAEALAARAMEQD